VLSVESVEAVAHSFKNVPSKAPVPLCFTLQDVELDVKELFKFETKFSLLILVGNIRKVDLVHGTVQINQLQFLQKPGWKGLFKFLWKPLDQIGHQFRDRLGSEVVILQFFRC